MLGAFTEERIRVRYGETDAMGHAYYAHYFFWFEQARGAWCRARGFSYASLEERGYFLPVVEAHARYLGEMRYDDVAIVQVRLSEIRRSAIRFDYEVINETNGIKATDGHTWHVLMGAERRAVAIPPEVRELLVRAPSSDSDVP
jgi:acyl-CoA thioester hydrolase